MRKQSHCGFYLFELAFHLLSPSCVFSPLHIFGSDSDSLMFIISKPSRPWDVCHSTESLLSVFFFASHLTLSANLFWPLAFVHVNWRMGKTSNWPFSTWQGDVAKKKTLVAGWERAAQRGGDGDRVGGGSFIFLSVHLNVEKRFEMDLGMQQTKAEPSILGLKVIFMT